MKNRYSFANGASVQKIKELPSILQLQMNRNAILASMRWCHSLSETASEVRASDQLIAGIAAASWAAVGLCTIENSSDLMRRDVLRLDDSRKTWDECFNQPRSALVGALHKARNKYFAHWDPDVVQKGIERVVAGEIAPVFMEWNEKRNLDSLCSMAYVIVGTDFLGENDQAVRLRELTHMTDRIACMIEDLLAGLIEATGIKSMLVRSSGGC